MLTNLPSRVDSSDSLVRGADLIRKTTMSLEHDEEFQRMAAEKNRLLDTQRTHGLPRKVLLP